MPGKTKSVVSTIWIICLLNVMSLYNDCAAQQSYGSYSVVSPDTRLRIEITQKSAGTPNSRLYYRIELDSKEVMPLAPLGVRMEGNGGDFVSGLTLTDRSEAVVMETYSMPVGKKSRRLNRANEKTLLFTNAMGKEMELIIRAYDDAVAWRYRFLGKGPAKILSEASAFRFPAGTKAWLQPYHECYERFYDHKGTGEIGQYGMPGLFETPGGVWVLVTEAAVYADYAGARLKGTLDGDGVFEVMLDGTVRSELPWTCPWRVAIIGDDLGDIVESVVVDNLNPPCEVQDLSWIEPGRVTFPWWSDMGVNKKYQRLKEFVDFASEMGWEWIEFDTALMDDKNEGTDTWMRTPWVAELVKYAQAKNVSVYGWDNWRNLDTPVKRKKIFGLFNKLGIKGIKIDFLNSDSQEMFRFRDTAAADCLKHKLMLSFHGATIPRGQQRRWPHIMTWEAVRGAEWYLPWSRIPAPPAHNCTLPFTRNVLGSMDYTPVTFSTDRRRTTDAHELALSVIFESGWQCISDSPESYRQNRGMEFLKQVHAAWDDIHFIDGYPGKFVCLARRKGSDWFVAAINADEPRELNVALDFLTPGSYSVKLYKDSTDGKTIKVEEVTVDAKQGLRLALPAGGGFAVRFGE